MLAICDYRIKATIKRYSLSLDLSNIFTTKTKNGH